MFQRLIKLLIRTIANTFFRSVDVIGSSNVPTNGPVIFAGNHPNALMDGWLLTARCGRWPLHFMVNAKLWRYPLLGRALDAMGAVPVYPRSEFGHASDNARAFERLYEVIEAGNAVGVFPEGISHTESRLARLKTGTARIALSTAARGKARVTIIPCGFNYMQRHRFRSAVLLQFGEPIVIDDAWLQRFRDNEKTAVRDLTNYLAEALVAITLNAPDWRTLRFAETAKRLYKPRARRLGLEQQVELSRRFIDAWERAGDDEELHDFRDDVEEYQAHLDLLGIRDDQLHEPVSRGWAYRRVAWRAIKMLVLVPLAVPGAILHLPVGAVAAMVGRHFSYEMDDVATLKVLATVALLPLIYVAIAWVVGAEYGLVWGVLTIGILLVGFFATVWLLEKQTLLYVSAVSLLRQAHLHPDVETLREQRAGLVMRVRDLASRLADPAKPRMFTDEDFVN